MQSSDVLLCLGSRLDTRITGGVPKTFARKSKVIVVDIDKNEVIENIKIINISITKIKNLYNFMRILLILLIISYSTKIFPIEIYKLISENDLVYLFENNKKKWNETIVFLDKKKSLSKFNGSNDTYFLKSYFDNGSVLIMPFFNNDSVEKFILTYEFDIIDDELINIFLKHYNSYNLFCSGLVKNKSYINIEIIKCN